MRGGVMDLGELMRSVAEAASSNSKTPGDSKLPLAEAQLMELSSMAADYVAGCRFSPGDIVRPKANAFLKHQDRPHVVLEVYEKPYVSHDDQNMSGPMNGGRYDVRVAAYVDDGKICAWVTEAWMYEPWPRTEG